MVTRRIIPFLLLLATASADAQSNQLVISAAGNVVGANGTHFRSDIAITNLRGVAQQVSLQWLPQGSSGAALPKRTVSIAASDILTSEDFTVEVMQQTGLGAILIRAVDAAGEIDVDGRLYATSRIWTPQPDSNGTTSQSMPALPLTSVAHQRTLFTGHRMDGRYRVNFGVANLDTTITQTFVITVSGSVQTLIPVIIELSVPPASVAQTPIVWPEDPEMRIEVEVRPQAGGGKGTLYVPYVSSVDNTTGDSWSTLGVELEP